MGDDLPVALGKSPLVEALFEVRFEPSIPVAGEILPGVLFERFTAEPKISGRLTRVTVRLCADVGPDLQVDATVLFAHD